MPTWIWSPTRPSCETWRPTTLSASSTASRCRSSFGSRSGAIHVVPATGGGTPIVPAEGGTVATADGTVKLDFPAGALPVSGDSNHDHRDAGGLAPPDPTQVPGTTFEFGPDGTQFSQPVPLSIAYDPTQLPASVGRAPAPALHARAGIWKLVPGSQVDEALHRVTGSVSHFSTYHVGALPTLGDLTTAGDCGVFMPDVGGLRHRDVLRLRLLHEPVAHPLPRPAGRS